jgi:trehalose 6-phosphate phosphatase
MTRNCLSALVEIEAALVQAHRVLIASDFDGTLCPITETPGEARLPLDTAEILRFMRGCEGIMFAILSGRTLADVRQRMPSGHVYSGNHGLEIHGRGLKFEHLEAAGLRQELYAACQEVSAAASEWPGAWVEDKRLTATLHYRNVDPDCHRALRFAVRKRLASFGRKFRLRSGKKALEICPRVDWDKGSALRYIIERLGPFDVCICLGDDRTDESMFLANSGQLNIRVGCDGPTHADLFLSSAAETPIVLEYVFRTVMKGSLGVMAAIAPDRF